MNNEIMDKVQHRFDNLIKPVGSLAKLEKIVCRYAALKNNTVLDYPTKALVLFDFISEDLEWNLQCLRSADVSNTMFSVAQGDLLTLPAVDLIAFGHTLTKDAPRDLFEKTVEAMTQAMLLAAENNMLIVLDGVDSVRAAQLAYKDNKDIYKHLITSYQPISLDVDTQGYFDLSPLLKLQLNSENGLGALMAFNIIDAGVRAYKDMKTFDEAKVEYAVEDLK